MKMATLDGCILCAINILANPKQVAPKSGPERGGFHLIKRFD